MMPSIFTHARVAQIQILAQPHSTLAYLRRTEILHEYAALPARASETADLALSVPGFVSVALIRPVRCRMFPGDIKMLETIARRPGSE